MNVNAVNAQPLRPEANTDATFTGVEHEAPAADPAVLGLNGTGWVSLAMIVVIAIMIWKGVPRMIGAALDKKIAGIREQLDEATRLRAEAEALRADYEVKAREAAADVDLILAHAREEAALIVSTARADAETLIVRRAKIAEDKIAASERTAVAAVRGRAAEVAAQAAARLVAERLGHEGDRALVDRAIGAVSVTRLN